MESTVSEAEAVRAARAGDAAAYSVLVGLYQEVAFRAAYLIVRDAGAAEDVVQEGFVRAYRELGRFREGEPFRPWLLRIVSNLALNEVRSRGRKLGLLQRVGALRRETETQPADAPLVENEQARSVWAAINRLGEDDRLVLYLRYFLELDEREMATVLGRPAGTVKSRLHRASMRLRSVIEREFPELRENDG
ncbi:MAG: RNA polymerase sigma factor [Dehalococcoidia bacterium]